MFSDIPFGGHDSANHQFNKNKVLFFNYDHFSRMVISLWDDSYGAEG